MLCPRNFIFRLLSNCTYQRLKKKRKEGRDGNTVGLHVKSVQSTEIIGTLERILIIHRAEEELPSFNDS